MERTRLLVLLGFIGMKLLGTKSERLPPPRLTMNTPGIIQSGNSADLLCTAPSNYQGAIFFLFIRNESKALQSLKAPVTSHRVTFNLQQVTATDSRSYICLYQVRVSEIVLVSEPSNALLLTVTDDRTRTPSPASPKKAKQDHLPSPILTWETTGIVQNGLSVNLLCTAPRNYQGVTFYLNTESNAVLLQTLQASEDKHSVTFTLYEVTSSDARGYICFYQILESGRIHTSEPSNVVYLTVTYDRVLSTSSTSPSKVEEGYRVCADQLLSLDGRGSLTCEQSPHLGKDKTSSSSHLSAKSGTRGKLVPVNVSVTPSGITRPWIIPLVAGITILVFLVLSVFVAVKMIKRFREKRKKNQRERASVWTQQNMASDWSYNNMAYAMKPHSEVELSPTCQGDFSPSSPCNNMVDNGRITEQHFSTFRT